MNTDVSFRTWFQRSRYAREAGVWGDSPRSERKEICAVAVVAFTFKHDPVFAAHFLKMICGAGRGYNPRDYSIEFQPEHHADLVICSNDRRRLFVIEFKVGAELQPKQNPWHKSFYKKNGYGTKIQSDPRWKGFKERTYIVLQNSLISDRGLVKRCLRCLSRRWKDFIPTRRPKGLYADLLDSLGGFGIPSLKVWKGNRMKIGESTKSAVEMNQLLCKIADDFNFPGRRTWNINKDQNAWWFGMDWKKQSPGYKQLARAVNPQWGAFGWFGYQQNRNEKPIRALWFYCGDNEKNKQRTEQLLRRRLGKNSKRIRHDDESLYIAAPAQTAGQDHAWFTEIFNCLKDS